MKYTAILFCLAATAVAAKAASVSGQANVDNNSASAGATLVFPRIPGINAPLSSILPSIPTTTTSSPSATTSSPSATTSSPNARTNSSSNTNSSSPSSLTNGGSSMSNIAKLFNIPDPASLIPDILNPSKLSGAQVPQIPGLPNLSQLPQIPGLSNAIQEARNHVQKALNLGSDISGGIQQAVQEAFTSNDPTNAIRTIIRTIINAYLTVAENCPIMIIGNRVIQEGIRLAMEVAQSARNVIFGTT